MKNQTHETTHGNLQPGKGKRRKQGIKELKEQNGKTNTERSTKHEKEKTNGK